MKIASGQIAAVTGAASGIGLSLCRRLARAGVRIAMADIDGAALESAAAALATDGADVLTVTVDVSSAGSVEQFAEQVYDRFGALHLLCNNAGVVPPGGRVWDVGLDDWEWVVGVDLWGPIHGVRAFVPRMIASGEPGHVVNTASVAGILPFPNVGPYSIAKYGVVSLSEVLRASLVEQGASIGVSVLCPGYVATPLRQQSSKLRPAGPGWDGSHELKSEPDAMEPDAIAEIVVETVDAGRFWIVPHSAYRA